MSTPLRVGIAGLGTVGTSTFEILKNKKQTIAKKVGREIVVTAVSARDKNKDRGIDTSGLNWHENAADLANDADVDLVVELMGGASGAAYDLCKAALEAGKPVVTANKALIAEKGYELAQIASKNNASLMFEAAVAGGIPIIKTLKEALTGNNISRAVGILNGTCNYIMTAMELDARDFDEVLKEAQELGYAEADPTFDVDGIDASHKLAIITSIVFGCPPKLEGMSVDGVRDITLQDITYANELGYKIRLLGITRLTEKGIDQRVHPCMLPKNSPLARVDGVLNAVAVDTDALGPLLLEGAGAGGGPTASAVVADIADIAANRLSPAFGIDAAELKDAPFVSIDERYGEYYIRITAEDKSGVLSRITQTLSDADVGVETIHQPPVKDGQPAHIVILTHETYEKNIKEVLANIAKIEYVLETPRQIRIEA
jgi:homoserine dehydrogenase